jgi:hypothetical protein
MCILDMDGLMDLEGRLRKAELRYRLSESAGECSLSGWPWQLSPAAAKPYALRALSLVKSKRCAVGRWVSRGNNL